MVASLIMSWTHYSPVVTQQYYIANGICDMVLLCRAAVLFDYTVCKIDNFVVILIPLKETVLYGSFISCSSVKSMTIL